MGSIVRHHPESEIAFWVLTPEMLISDVIHDAARALGPRSSLNFLTAKDESWKLGMSHRRTAQHISEAAYLRIQLPSYLPPTVSRVLYLDADVLCTSRGLEELFELDLGESVVAAVRDAFTRRLADTRQLPGLEALPHLDPQALYFNSGVIAIDVDAWFEADVPGACESYLSATEDRRRFPDQDALNVALYRRWLRLPHRYNNMMASRLDSVRGGSLSDAVLVHSTGSRKYWHDDFEPGIRKSMYASIRAEMFGQATG